MFWHFAAQSARTCVCESLQRARMRLRKHTRGNKHHACCAARALCACESQDRCARESMHVEACIMHDVLRSLRCREHAWCLGAYRRGCREHRGSTLEPRPSRPIGKTPRTVGRPEFRETSPRTSAQTKKNLAIHERQRRKESRRPRSRLRRLECAVRSKNAQRLASVPHTTVFPPGREVFLHTFSHELHFFGAKKANVSFLKSRHTKNIQQQKFFLVQKKQTCHS